MIIQIINPETGIGEWCLLEFQGDILGKLEGESLGEIEFEKTKAELVIGSHLLEGVIENIKNPYLVIENQINSNTDIKYDMLGIVKKKIVFKTRPKPLSTISR